MLSAGPAKRVIIHLNEDTFGNRDFLHVEVFQFLLQSGVAGASLFRPQAGFGSHQRVHDSSVAMEREHLPVRIEFIEDPANVAALLPKLATLVTDGLIEVQDTTIYRSVVQSSNTEAVG